MPDIPNIKSADGRGGATSDQAGDATQTAVLNDVTKTPVVDQRTLSYNAPSTICCSSPWTEVRETAHGSLATNSQRRASRQEGTARRKRKRKARASSATRSNPVAHMLLKSCVFRKGEKTAKNRNQENDNTEILNDDRIQAVLQAGTLLLGNDLCGSLKSHLENWENNQSLSLHALDIPAQWQGIKAAAAYFIRVDSDDIADLVGTRGEADPLRRSIASDRPTPTTRAPGTFRASAPSAEGSRRGCRRTMRRAAFPRGSYITCRLAPRSRPLGLAAQYGTELQERSKVVRSPSLAAEAREI